MDNREAAQITPLRRVRVRAHKGPFRERMRDRLQQARDAGERSAPFFLALASLMISVMGALSFSTEGKRILHTHGQYHSWAHLLGFAVIGFVLVRAGRNDVERRWLFIGAMVMGFAIELGEHFLFHNPLEWKDVFMDVTGAVNGTLAALTTLLELKRRQEIRERRQAQVA
ncbi:MAG TPA: hypothetical protein VIM62_04605 [Acidobacteriaceae bacterium]